MEFIFKENLMNITKVSVILPTYNEKENIISLIRAILRYISLSSFKPEIVVVDDNSPDGTAKIVKRKFNKNQAIKIFVRKKDRGLASAINYGISKSKNEIVVIMDTDFNHDPKLLPKMIKALRNNDIVIGSRYIKGGGMENKTRERLSKYFNILITWILRSSVHDNLSGFFVVRKSFLKKINKKKIFYGYGDYFIRFLYYSGMNHAKFCEIPCFYKNRIYGVSKSNFINMAITYFFSVIKCRFSR